MDVVTEHYSRGNLKDDRVRSEYERGYQIILDFFLKYL